MAKQPNHFTRQSNQYTLTDDTYTVKTISGTFYISKEDYGLVSQYHWTIDKSHNYVVTTVKGKKTYLHRLLLEPKNGLICDHINRNKLDNRRTNLRAVSYSANNKNCGAKGKSGHKFINIKRGRYYVKGWGSFDDIKEAILARNILQVYNALIRE